MPTLTRTKFGSEMGRKHYVQTQTSQSSLIRTLDKGPHERTQDPAT